MEKENVILDKPGWRNRAKWFAPTNTHPFISVTLLYV